jgi:hypothetical protein
LLKIVQLNVGGLHCQCATHQEFYWKDCRCAGAQGNLHQEDLNREVPGRGDGRRFGQQRPRGRLIRKQNEMRGRDEDKCGRAMEKFQFFDFKLGVGFFFGLPSFGDGFAEGAGMFAVESFFDGFGKRGDARVVREHPGPGDGLQGGPMSAGRGKQGDDQQQMANA